MISPYLTPKSPPENSSALLQSPPREIKPPGRAFLSPVSGVQSPFVRAGSLQAVPDWAHGGSFCSHSFFAEKAFLPQLAVLIPCTCVGLEMSPGKICSVSVLFPELDSCQDVWGGGGSTLQWKREGFLASQRGKWVCVPSRSLAPSVFRPDPARAVETCCMLLTLFK